MDEHEHFQDLISEKLDGVISAADDRALADHLASCPDCRELFALLSDAHEALELQADPPDGLVAEVMTAVRAEKARRKLRIRSLAGILAAAAVLTAVVIPAAVRARSPEEAGDFVAAPFSMVKSDGGSPVYPTDPAADEPADEPAACNESAPGEGSAIPVWPGSTADDMDPYTGYRAVAWFDSLPEEIVCEEGRLFPDGSVGYDVTGEQFEALLDGAFAVEYPDPDGAGYMVLLSAR